MDFNSSWPVANKRLDRLSDSAFQCVSNCQTQILRCFANTQVLRKSVFKLFSMKKHLFKFPSFV